MTSLVDFQLVTTADYKKGKVDYVLFVCTWCDTRVEKIIHRFNTTE
ncbi:hypothetical protein [Pseudoalteromonas sp. Isolate6]|nr:hypothetical protein [Pseudoalteromonas sp. Isolate6]